MCNLDAHQRPPDLLKQSYKKYSKRDSDHFKHDVQVIDFSAGLRAEQNDFAEIEYGIEEEQIRHVFQSFLHQDGQPGCPNLENNWHFSGTSYECKSINGMSVTNSLLCSKWFWSHSIY